MAPFLVFLYNSNTGAVVQLPAPIADVELRSGLGWHGPFNTKQDALDFYTNNKDANPGWHEPAGWKANIAAIPQLPGQRASNAASNVLEPFKGVNLGAWLLRIGEVVLGIVLIGVGIAKLTGTTNTITRMVGKIPPIIPV